jgi:DNA-binding NarL/FixJ family response regulator
MRRVTDRSAIRIVVADDHPVVRGGLVHLLGTLPALEVVGEAADGAEAVAVAAERRPAGSGPRPRTPGCSC